MSELWNSVANWFKERTTSPLYGTFLLSLILWNWKFFYILFWQNEAKLVLPRIEYVQIYLLNQEGFLYHLFYFLILPLISTYFIVWWLPFLSNLAHKKSIDFYYARKLTIDQARLDYEKKEKKTLDSISTVKKEQAETKKEIEKNTAAEEVWGFEFDNFKQHPIYSEMQKLKEIIYDNSGQTRRWNGLVYQLAIDSNTLATADSLGLILIKGIGKDERIELTPKGKFFMSKYLESI
jgi:hypothetical protein